MRQLAGYRHQRSEINMSQHLPRRPSFVRTTHRLTKVYGLMAAAATTKVGCISGCTEDSIKACETVEEIIELGVLVSTTAGDAGRPVPHLRGRLSYHERRCRPAQ